MHHCVQPNTVPNWTYETIEQQTVCSFLCSWFSWEELLIRRLFDFQKFISPTSKGRQYNTNRKVWPQHEGINHNPYSISACILPLACPSQLSGRKWWQTPPHLPMPGVHTRRAQSQVAGLWDDRWKTESAALLATNVKHTYPDISRNHPHGNIIDYFTDLVAFLVCWVSKMYTELAWYQWTRTGQTQQERNWLFLCQWASWAQSLVSKTMQPG